MHAYFEVNSVLLVCLRAPLSLVCLCVLIAVDLALVAPYRAILRYYGCDTPYRAILLREVITPPKLCDTPLST